MTRPILLLFGAGLLALVVFAVWNFTPSRGSRGSGGPIPPGSLASADVMLPVRSAIARKGDLTHHLTTSGTLRARKDVEIQARVDGILTHVPAFNGRFVHRGDTLAALDGREYLVAFERARAGLLNAQIEYRTLSATPFLAATDSLENARHITLELHALDSLRTLHRSGILDDASFERLAREREAALAYRTANRGDVIAGRSGLAAAREAYETARLNLAWTTITAPFDGYVADCPLAPGMHVDAGQALLKLLDLTTVLVDVEILETEIGRVATGQYARILPAGLPGKEFAGKVLHMNPLVDAAAKTMKVTIELRDDPHHGPSLRLRPGMFATVHIETDVVPGQVLIPRAAVLVRDGRPLVFVVENGRAQWRYVETGATNDEHAVIRSGVRPGDSVIVDGHYTLAHDAPVSVLPTDRTDR